MSDSYKKSAKMALEKYLSKQAAPAKPKRRNKKPEAEAQKLCLAWLKTNGFVAQHIEAKATWSPEAGIYKSQAASAGTSDIVGVCPGGTALFVEMKAPGKRSTLKPHQREYLIERLQLGAFVACADSPEYLSEVYETWIKLKPGSDTSKDYLKSQLHQKGTSSDKSADGADPFDIWVSDLFSPDGKN